jgi:hypothetical protein
MGKDSVETRLDRFRRVATRRTNKILDQIRILGNCSNKSSYSYTDEDIQKIFLTIERELRLVKAKFPSKNKNKFTL